MGLVIVRLPSHSGQGHDVLMDDVSGQKYPVHRLAFGSPGDENPLVSAGNPFPVATKGVTQTEFGGNDDTPFPTYPAGAGRDTTTGAATGIDYGHHQIHAANSFSVFLHKPVYTAAVPTYFTATQTISVAFHTPVGSKLVHMFAFADASDFVFFRILRGVTVTNNTGTSYAPVNMYDRHSNASIVDDAMTTPTVNRVRLNATIAGGVAIHSELLGSGGKKSGDAAGGRGIHEHVLRANTNYCCHLQRPNVAADGTANLSMIWYEHTNR